MKICLIHDNKPDVCKNWPNKQQDIDLYERCTLYFDDGKMKGKCCKCGDCCLKPYIIPPGCDRKFTNEPCPYLKEINGD